MKFYFNNLSGDYGEFETENLILAIYSAWNIEADLYFHEDDKLVFAPHESNEFNSELLKEFGFYMTDGNKYREIRKIDTDEEVKYEWNDVIDLI
jgi:hypothetical protein